jgi:hypothetical protein
MVSNLIMLQMLYLYIHHNTYCEPYVCSFFCLSVYALVVTNMIYHIVSLWHFVRTAAEKSRREEVENLNFVTIERE